MKNQDYRNPGTTASIIAERDDKICLIRRKHPPYRGFLALPGGFLNYKQENLKHTAQREFFEETQYRVKLSDLELLEVNSEVDRDPRDHVIDHIYIARKFTGKGVASDDAAELYWTPICELPKKMAFDHRKVLERYLCWRLKNRAGIN